MLTFKNRKVNHDDSMIPLKLDFLDLDPWLCVELCSLYSSLVFLHKDVGNGVGNFILRKNARERGTSYFAVAGYIGYLMPARWKEDQSFGDNFKNTNEIIFDWNDSRAIAMRSHLLLLSNEHVSAVQLRITEDWNGVFFFNLKGLS